jgi:glycosidase
MKKGQDIFMQKKLILILICIVTCWSSFSQEITLKRVEPPSWWTGFKNPALQIMIYGKNIGKTDPAINAPGVELKRVNRMENPDYLFLDIILSKNVQPGFFAIAFYKDKQKVTEYLYQLRKRKEGSSARKSFDASDVIYLIMPDRFSNGDPENDNIEGYLEKMDRSNPDGRHGGDIQGIMNHLDYVKDLGATTIWINPLLENNMAKYSYHGYSITDYYKIDPRFGNNDDYVALSNSIHQKGMKLIMDMVFNHCGANHWWMADLPAKDWLNQFPEFTRTSYRSSTVTDPYRSQYDSIHFLKGWFDETMPDLNQHNPFLARYLIQNSIWWIEFAGLDGIRQDTYPYSFKDFMSEWDKEVLSEYPNFNIVGECWSAYPDGIAYWQKDALNRDHFNTYLPSVFDFAMYDALKMSFNEKDGWSTGISRLYEILSRDFSYADPTHIVVFADSHDADRYLATQGQDVRKLKMAMAFILTTRGIPMIYYGTEVLLTTEKGTNGDGYKRADFPGGWKNDTINGFTGKNLSPAQVDMKQYLTHLLNWRKDKEVIHTGKLTQFIPDDGVYVYFRHNKNETVMVALNNNENDPRLLDRIKYSEFLDHFDSGKDVITGQDYNNLSKIIIQPKSALIIELKIKN